jgi:hypothetical protein
MNKIQTFEQFLATTSSQFSVWGFIFNLLLTAILAHILGLLYNRYGNSLSNRKAFSKNFVMLAVTTMIIITIVKSSLALSLGLVGALSIVRFRSAIKEPEELTYLFLNIAIGLGFGADQRIATIIGFAFILLYQIFKRIVTYKTNTEYNCMIITISALNPIKDQLDGMAGILKKGCRKVDLKRFDENNSTLEVSFIIEVDNFEKLNETKNELNNSYNNITISLIDNNIIL